MLKRSMYMYANICGQYLRACLYTMQEVGSLQMKVKATIFLGETKIEAVQSSTIRKLPAMIYIYVCYICTILN